ncbi:MAG TPA: TraB/GumN family protein, partial [Cytophagales bacterium]
MKSTFRKIVLLLVLLSGQRVAAQEGPQSSSLLWKITGNGLAQPSYLYGTMHFIPLTDFVVSNSVVQAFMSSKILATENASFMRYIPRQVWHAQSQQKLLPGGRTAAAYLSEADFAELKTYMRKGLKIKASTAKKYLRLKPNYLAGALLGRLYPQSTGYEIVFLHMAQQRNNRKQYMLYEGLEEPKQTFAAFDSLRRLYQVEELMRGVRSGFAEYHDLVQTYRTQDVEALYNASV